MGRRAINFAANVGDLGVGHNITVASALLAAPQVATLRLASRALAFWRLSAIAWLALRGVETGR
jgi:hypothetical protein